MAHSITVIGVGPGSPDFLTPAGSRALAQADLVVGAKRLLITFAQPHQEVYPLGADLAEAAEFIRRKSEEKQVAVLVSGDTGLYSFADYLAERLPADRLTLVPGISSVQLMFARLKRPWQEAVIISRHGRQDRRLIQLVQSGLVVAVLTDRYNTPQLLAAELLTAGCQDLPVAVGCNLSYDDETIYRGKLSSLRESTEQFVNCVVVIGV
ncbi:precorrin-6y C5,15-methyltransferase (decarboxylating) subunit CbiE [Desulfotomaculum nigrificans]|uniref:precorrin-6y C5,15-methyltransferase (decarboxylating) subunit CbiE n=1 Tax=Desulfotomaculum nigrificans TaxID=1565 RepID=UPI0001FADE95|nr:precorrin-6y C5,15-methyltransferase (decarboxylating) subunit CbiE [Desulfotomaculum nigrificans]